MVKGTISDGFGHYRLNNIVAGSYYIRFTSIGFRDRYSNAIDIHGTTSLSYPDVIICPDANQLKAVTVYGSRHVMEHKNDGIIYNAGNDIAIAAGNAADVLRRIPIINIDQNGNLSIPGKMSIKVFIDNKPSDIYGSSVSDALKQIPAEEIDKVEVITSPSARYEAEGSDAVINIITKKKKFNGTNGSIRTVIKSFNRELSSGIKIRRNSLVYNLDLGVYSSNFYGTDKLLRTDLNNQTPTRLAQETDFKNSYWSYYMGIGIIKVLDSLKTFTAGFRFRNGQFNRNNIVYNNYMIKDIISSQYNRNIEYRNKTMGSTVNMGYTAKSANKKNELNLLGVFFSYDALEDYDLDQVRNDVTDYKEINRGISDNRELSLQIDDVFRIKEKTNIEAGLKAAFRYFALDSKISIFDFVNTDYLKDPVRSNNFSYNRGVYAAYINYGFSMKKWEFRIGARYELTTLLADFKDTSLSIPNYKNLAPNFLISKKIDNNNSIRFSYKKNILRPYLQYLNPNINYVDSLNISYGNPYLLPAIQHGLQLVHGYIKKTVSWTNTVFLNYNVNNIETIRRIRPDGILENTYLNVGKNKEAGVITGISLNRQKGFSLNLSANIKYVEIKSEALQLSSSGFVFGSNLNTSYRFDKSFGIDASVRYNSRSVYLQGYGSQWVQHGIGVSKKLFNDKVNITAGADDFFVKFLKFKSATRTLTFEQYNEGRYRARSFRIGISYTFGKKDLSIPQTRQANIEE